jgi:hypothetical protein
MKCKTCEKELVGLQRKFCCRQCKYRSNNFKHNNYKQQQRRGLERKLFFVNQLGNRCSECGYNKNLASLAFHHIDPSSKKLNLDFRAMSNNSMKVLQAEVDRCKLLCHNCHGELHHPDLNLATLLYP